MELTEVIKYIGSGTGVLGFWGYLIFWAIKSKLRDEVLTVYATKQDLKEELMKYYSQDQVHSIFVSEKTHELVNQSFSKVIDAKFEGLEKQLKNIKDALDRLIVAKG
jgi:hypothetical protein